MLPGCSNLKYVRYFYLLLFCMLFFTCCAHVQKREMEVTAYCGCKKCCSWTRGNWKYLKLNFWNRYYVSGPDKGARYRGRTASGTKPREYNPGLVSIDSVKHPWMIPVRIVFFWLIFPYPGTIAADTNYYPFGWSDPCSWEVKFGNGNFWYCCYANSRNSIFIRNYRS